MNPETRALAYVVPFIALLLATLFAFGGLVTLVLGLPSGLSELLWLQPVGILILLTGFAQMAWLLRYRGIRSVLLSTFVTFRKLVKRIPLDEVLERKEPLVIEGPYKYVRHPLYLGVVVMVLGWAVFSDSTFVLVSTVVLFLWFRLLLGPFEEKELKAIFGPDYEQYSRRVPSMVPFTKLGSRRRQESSTREPMSS